MRIVTLGAFVRGTAGPGGFDVELEEFAVFDDGRRVQSDARDGGASIGMGISGIAVLPAGEAPTDVLPEPRPPLAELEAEVRDTVLGWPDGGEPTETRWIHLRSALRREGLDVPLGDLDAAPFTLELDPALARQLA